ncbi:HNH endonuclease [Niabella insulamsoli]|uniref:HNH endonuclease n=1 Tax=Niabella insulamsoli TaxID=3144874 RepID=UPI003CCC8724
MAALLVILFAIASFILNRYLFELRRRKRIEYYRNTYLKSEAWQRKRFVVLRRDNWPCVYCGDRANQVHHKKYAKYRIGKEPIKWLESVCSSCHDSLHNRTRDHFNN